MGLKPRSSFKSWTFVALDPFEDLLLGPTFGAAKVFVFSSIFVNIPPALFFGSIVCAKPREGSV